MSKYYHYLLLLFIISGSCLIILGKKNAIFNHEAPFLGGRARRPIYARVWWARVHLHMYICMYMYIYIHIYIHTYIHIGIPYGLFPMVSWLPIGWRVVLSTSSWQVPIWLHAEALASPQGDWAHRRSERALPTLSRPPQGNRQGNIIPL